MLTALWNPPETKFAMLYKRNGSFLRFYAIFKNRKFDRVYKRIGRVSNRIVGSSGAQIRYVFLANFVSQFVYEIRPLGRRNSYTNCETKFDRFYKRIWTAHVHQRQSPALQIRYVLQANSTNCCWAVNDEKLPIRLVL